MQPALVLRAAARKPLIKFLGKRTPTRHAPASHPFAPEDIVAKFSSLFKNSGAAAAVTPSGRFIPLYPASKKAADYEDWEAPAYLRHRPEMTEREIEAIMSGGATNILTGA